MNEAHDLAYVLVRKSTSSWVLKQIEIWWINQSHSLGKEATFERPLQWINWVILLSIDPVLLKVNVSNHRPDSSFPRHFAVVSISKIWWTVTRLTVNHYFFLISRKLHACFIRNISSKFAITQFWTVIAFCPILNRSHCLSFSSHLVSTISPFHVFILLECFKILYIPLLFSSSSSCFARRKDFSTEKCRSCERMKNTYLRGFLSEIRCWDLEQKVCCGSSLVSRRINIQAERCQIQWEEKRKKTITTNFCYELIFHPKYLIQLHVVDYTLYLFI